MQNKQQTAVNYCLDCADGLCSYCKDIHKSMSNHTIVAMKELPINYSLSFCCTKHKQQSLDYLCIDHDELCCLGCIPIYHSNCKTTKHIDVIAIENIKSKAFLNYEIQLSDCVTKFKKIINQGTQNKNSIHSDCNKIERDLIENENMETNFAKKLNTDLTSVKTIGSVTQDHHISEAKKLESGREELQRLFDFFKKTGSNKLLSLYIHSSKQEMTETQLKMEFLFGDMICPSVQYIEYEKGNAATGRIVLSYGKDVTIPSLKKQQSETGMEKPIVLEIVSFISELKIETENVQGGIAESHYGVLLLCDTNNSRVVMISENKQNIYLDLEYEPENISVIPDSDTAVLTSKACDFIQFIDINERKVIDKKEVEGSATCSIACSTEYLLIGGKMKISVLDHKGTHIRDIETDCELRSLSYFDEKMYFTEKDSNKVQCMEINGKSVYCHQSQTVAAPITAIPDKDGQVYILDKGQIIEKRKIPRGYFNSMHTRGPITIHKLTTSGQNVRLEISENADLQNPISMCLNKDGTKLYVLHKNGSSICMFKIEATQQL